MQGSLRDKTARGVGWSFIDNIANSGITFLVGLVLARLLTPEEYGVMAMIAIFYSGVRFDYRQWLFQCVDT